MKILRCCCSNSTGGKLFAINLLFTTKQYKVDDIDNFVYYGKTRMNLRFVSRSKASDANIGIIANFVYL